MESRRHQRHRRSLKVIWKDKELICESITRDICAGGVFIVTSRSICPKDVIQIEFIGENPGPAFRCSGRIVWVNSGQVETYPPGFGVEILDVEAHSMEFLLDQYDECE